MIRTIRRQKTERAAFMRLFLSAERQGFEPWDQASWSTVFETAPIDHSGIFPLGSPASCRHHSFLETSIQKFARTSLAFFRKRVQKYEQKMTWQNKKNKKQVSLLPKVCPIGLLTSQSESSFHHEEKCYSLRHPNLSVKMSTKKNQTKIIGESLHWKVILVSFCCLRKKYFWSFAENFVFLHFKNPNAVRI